MALAAALGINLWIVVVALPLGVHALGGGAGGLGAGRIAGAVGLGLLPLGALALGARRRSGLLLLAAVPALLALPELVAPADPALPGAALVLAVASLVAYLAAAAQAVARAEAASALGATLGSGARKLYQDPTPSRWRRRLRVYRLLTATALLHPLVLLGFVGLSPSLRGGLRASFGVHAAQAQALLAVAVGLLWAGLYRAYWIDPLRAHLQHDRDLVATMELDRRHAAEGRPRALFYLAVAVALLSMGAVLWQRSH